jgi:hypothetical protein
MSRRLFRLISCDGRGTPRVLVVPEGSSSLWIEDDTVDLRSDGGASEYALEPLRRGRALALLVVAAGRPFRINGVRSAHVAALREGDLVGLGAGAGALLEVALAVEARPGRPPAECLGRNCPICLAAVVEGTRVYLCPACGAAIHCEEPERPQPLRCLDLCTECPGCGEPVAPALRATPGAGGRRRHD